MKHKDSGMFNFNYTRGCDCVKLLFSAQDLSQKPIKYWANTGNVNKKGNFYKIISLVKKLTGDITGNGISHLYYYGGSRLIFPFHVHWMEDKFELIVYNCFGDGEGKLIIARNVKSDNERLTKEEITKIKAFLCLQYNIVYDGYDFINKYMKEGKDYADVRSFMKDIKTKINP